MSALSVPWQVRRGWGSTKTISHVVRNWNRGVAAIMGLRVRVEGELPAVDGGLVVSNHLSYLDIIAHGAVLPIRYAAKSEIAGWPLLGWYLGLSRPVWVRRQSKQASQRTLEEFAETMKAGMNLIVYPEGTSTDGKSGILPFKSTAFEAAIMGNAPIIPVLISYKEVEGRQTPCWYGDMTLVPHVWQMLRFPSIEATVRFLKPIYPEGRQRKELASHVREEMLRAYEMNAAVPA